MTMYPCRSIRRRIRMLFRKTFRVLTPFIGKNAEGRNHHFVSLLWLLLIFLTGLTLGANGYIDVRSRVSHEQISRHYAYAFSALVFMETIYWMWLLFFKDRLRMTCGDLKWRLSQDLGGFLCCSEQPEYKKDHVQNHLLYGCTFMAIILSFYYLWLLSRMILRTVCGVAAEGVHDNYLYAVVGDTIYAFALLLHTWLQMIVAFHHRKGSVRASLHKLSMIIWIISLNLTVYFQITMMEAFENKHILQEISSGGHHALSGFGSCFNESGVTLQTMEQHHHEWIQPLGYAIAVEFVLTLNTVFISLWYHAGQKAKHHHKGKRKQSSVTKRKGSKKHEAMTVEEGERFQLGTASKRKATPVIEELPESDEALLISSNGHAHVIPDTRVVVADDILVPVRSSLKSTPKFGATVEPEPNGILATKSPSKRRDTPILGHGEDNVKLKPALRRRLNMESAPIMEDEDQASEGLLSSSLGPQGSDAEHDTPVDEIVLSKEPESFEAFDEHLLRKEIGGLASAEGTFPTARKPTLDSNGNVDGGTEPCISVRAARPTVTICDEKQDPEASTKLGGMHDEDEYQLPHKKPSGLRKHSILPWRASLRRQSSMGSSQGTPEKKISQGAWMIQQFRRRSNFNWRRQSVKTTKNPGNIPWCGLVLGILFAIPLFVISVWAYNKATQLKFTGPPAHHDGTHGNNHGDHNSHEHILDHSSQFNQDANKSLDHASVDHANHDQSLQKHKAQGKWGHAITPHIEKKEDQDDLATIPVLDTGHLNQVNSHAPSNSHGSSNKNNHTDSHAKDLSEAAHAVQDASHHSVDAKVFYYANIYEGVAMGSHLFMTILSIISLYLANHMKPSKHLHAHEQIDIILLLITMFGMMMLSSFAFSAILYPWLTQIPSEGRLKLIVGLEIIMGAMQVFMQTMVIVKGFSTESTRYDKYSVQLFNWRFTRRHIGKVVAEIYMILTAYNFLMWIVHAFYERRVNSLFHHTVTQFYPRDAWLVITEITYPMSICYYFHSMICLLALMNKFATHWRSRT